MSIPFLRTFTSSIEQQIAQLERSYREALLLDAPFAVAKEIKMKIKMLRAKDEHKKQAATGKEKKD